MSGKVQLAIEPLSGRFDPQDDRWLDQVTSLMAELRREVDGLSLNAAGSPGPGHKGMVDSIVLSLASAGSLTAMVELVKAWLGRDRTRSLKVSWFEDGAVQSIELGGSGVDGAAFDDLVRAVSERLAGPT